MNNIIVGYDSCGEKQKRPNQHLWSKLIGIYFYKKIKRHL